MQYKFEDCSSCRFRRRPDICNDCDCGEYFEDASIPALRFDNDAINYARADKSLTTDEDEPNFNPDDLIERLDEQVETNDEE